MANDVIQKLPGSNILANIKGIQISRDLDTQLMCYPTCKKENL